MSYAVSIALASLVASNTAVGQENKSPAGTGAEAEVAQVLIVGTRASQQTAIERKKNAATAMDSIVAEDVGAFPDRNVGEAISRIAGVALDRGEFGEGVCVSVRGTGADLTRVEIDGQGVQAGGGTDLNGGGNGRGVELRELSSDLIKSVDVVKGSTADMTEGALGGGIIIKTRTGLDFKERFISARVAASQGSINKKWSPDLNFVFADKFLDNKLGVIVNVSKSGNFNEFHSTQVSTSGTAGYFRLLDFDNSPEKTFSFNPALLSATDPIVNQPTAQFNKVGGGFVDASTPMQILTKSAAATTKAGCYAAFPALTVAEQALITSGTQRNNAIVHRGNELTTCLNQWNDYTPSLLRYIVKQQEDKRLSGDLRVDYKVNNKLTVYAKGNRGTRTVDDTAQTFGLGGLSVNTATATPTYSGPTFVDSAAGVRTAIPGTGYYTYDYPSFRTGLVHATNSVANVDPASVTVDKNHHLVKYTISDGSAGTDQIHNTIKTNSQYMQAGGSYRDGPLKVEFFVGDAKSDFQRGDKRTSWSTNYGPATMSVLPNGTWTYDFPKQNPLTSPDLAGYSIARAATTNAAAVKASSDVPVAIPAYTIAQQPLRTQAPQISFTPRMGDTHEKTAKVDLSYAFSDKVPVFTLFKAGINLRDTSGNQWYSNGGYTVQSAVGNYGEPGFKDRIQMPNSIIRSSFIGCQDTPGSKAAGGQPCVYGYIPSTNLGTPRQGQLVLTPAGMQSIISQSMLPATSQFYHGMPDRPAGLINGWDQIDVDKAFALVGQPNVNFDCVKFCTASDGKVYAQPVNTFSEKSSAAYVMTDFDLSELPFTKMSLPFGIELNGNFGYRIIRTDVKGSGLLSFTSITKTASFDPFNPEAPGGIVSSTATKATSIAKVTTDILPVFNLALWAVPNQVVFRYNRAKTVGRPPVQRLLPSGTCTYDERRLVADTDGSDTDMTCRDPVGNPALRARTNVNQNFSVEWYANKDTMFSLGKFIHRGIIGEDRVVGRNNVKIFEGTNAVDPVTGKSLSDLEFSYTTYENGPVVRRTGLEFASKTALTFLPSVLKYTGVDVNYTKLQSAASTVTIRDLLTGETLPTAGEPEYSYNASLWYDDGAFTARVALQVVASVFQNIAANGATSVNNFPNDAGGRVTILPYNPGSPNFRDATRYVDAKVAYRFKNGVELFAEARNIGLSKTSTGQMQYAPFADGTPNLNSLNYNGRRIMVGMNVKL